MRGTYPRDWIAWSLVAAIAIVAGAEYFAQQTGRPSPIIYLGEKLVVTAPRPSH
jgi:hypothetical protein